MRPNVVATERAKKQSTFPYRVNRFNGFEIKHSYLFRKNCCRHSTFNQPGPGICGLQTFKAQLELLYIEYLLLKLIKAASVCLLFLLPLQAVLQPTCTAALHFYVVSDLMSFLLSLMPALFCTLRYLLLSLPRRHIEGQRAQRTKP